MIRNLSPRHQLPSNATSTISTATATIPCISVPAVSTASARSGRMPLVTETSQKIIVVDVGDRHGAGADGERCERAGVRGVESERNQQRLRDAGGGDGGDERGALQGLDGRSDQKKRSAGRRRRKDARPKHARRAIRPCRFPGRGAASRPPRRPRGGRPRHGRRRARSRRHRRGACRQAAHCRSP